MIKTVSIRNYKSIKALDITASRINVFIGEHNSGKSNILEALSWLSVNALDSNVFPEMFRFKTATDFFYDFDVTRPLEVSTDRLNLLIQYATSPNGALLNELSGTISPAAIHQDAKSAHNKGRDNINSFRFFFDGKIESHGVNIDTPFRTYIFRTNKTFKNSFRPFLDPPFGENIPSLLISNKRFKDLVADVFREKGYKLLLKPTETDIEMAKEVDGELYSYRYASISETLQRVVFYLLAIESNKDATLILDEPETNTFPMYTKQLAERIARNETNQYFIATHNPYLLDALVNKTPMKDLSVFVVGMTDYETKVRKVTDQNLSAIMDNGADVYFNLDKLVD